MTTRISIPRRLPDSEEALLRVRPLAEALAEAEVDRRNTLDLGIAAETIGATQHQLDVLRDALSERFGAAALEAVDLLPVLAAAGVRCEALCRLSPELNDLSPLSREIAASYGELFAFGELVVRKGLVPQEQLDACRGMQGYRTQYRSLQALETLLRSVLGSLPAQALVTLADLDRAKQLAAEMQAALGARTHGSLTHADEELRDRVATLLVTTHGKVRRFVEYVRWHEGDADRYVPSLAAAQRAVNASSAPNTTPTDGSGNRPAT